MKNNVIQRFPRNTLGRDFVCSDVHGYFDLLLARLDEVKFDISRDRLFGVGDLVDRGPFSAECLDWIGQRWFHTVRGNHEQMAMGIAAGNHNPEHYIKNGGAWFLKLRPDLQRAYADVFNWLPYMIEVDTSHGRVGIVHAEIRGPSWAQWVDDFEHATSNYQKKLHIERCLWSRKKIDAWDEHGEVPAPIYDLHMLVVGHSRVPQRTALANIHYIDTGAYKTGNLTVIQIDGPTPERSDT